MRLIGRSFRGIMFRVKTPTFWITFAIVLVIAGVAVASCNLRTGGSVDTGEFPEEFAPLLEVYEALREDHISSRDLDPERLTQGAIRGMLQSLDDPHAVYMNPDQWSLESTKYAGSFEGIGAEVTMREGQIIIVKPIPDTPADKAGIQPGDIILQVDGESTRGLLLMEAIAKIRGPQGTPVDLLVQRRSTPEPVALTIIRGTVKVPSLNLRVMTGGIGHLQVYTFSQNTGDEMKKAFETIERNRVKGVILDLRNNLGGLVSAGVEVTSAFVDSGLVLYQIDGEGNRKDYGVRPGANGKEIPLVVLVNEFSASASEFVAGALRDHDRALLIGTKTYGKGSVNVPLALADGSGVFYTIARWYTPKGTLIEGEGIEPDIESLPDPEGVDDPQLDKAIEVLEGIMAEKG